MVTSRPNYRLTWMAEALRKAGLHVVERPGWRSRGHGDVKDIRLIMCHHTAEAIDEDNDPEVIILEHGRPGLVGPLANLGLGQDGTWYCVAAGLAWHAGTGSWPGVPSGNAHSIGIEAENNGIGEKWPEVQLESFAKGCAALCRYLGKSEAAVIGHKEWAPKRKIDPNFDMNDFRKHVAEHLHAPVRIR